MEKQTNQLTAHLSFSSDLTHTIVHVNSWDEADLCAKGTGACLDFVVDKITGKPYGSKLDLENDSRVMKNKVNK